MGGAILGIPASLPEYHDTYRRVTCNVESMKILASDFRDQFPWPHYVSWELWMLGLLCHWWDLGILSVPWVKTQSGCWETGSLLLNCLVIELLYIYLILPGKQFITMTVPYKSWSVLWIKKGFCWEREHLKNLGLYLTPPHWVAVERGGAVVLPPLLPAVCEGSLQPNEKNSSFHPGGSNFFCILSPAFPACVCKW